jgi:ATP-dependent RNA helicase DHX29
MRLSLSDLALRIKILKVDLGSSIEDVLSRALDPPSSLNVQRAVSALVEVCSPWILFGGQTLTIC